MPHHYEIHTTIPRNFDLEVVGIALDSIISTCEGYINHIVPLVKGDTIIRMETSKPLDEQYLIDQLDDNFQAMGDESNVVRKIVRKDL